MQDLPAALELPSPKSHLRKLRRKGVCVRVAVALVLVFSICALLYAIAHDPAAASLSLGVLA